MPALAGQVGEEGGTIATDVTDISDPANAPGLIGRAIGAFGHIDVLVNNAGAAASGPIAMQTDEALRVQFGTHVFGPLALVREALPTLRASRGHVFMLGSGVARVPVAGMGCLSAVEGRFAQRDVDLAARTRAARHRGDVRRSGRGGYRLHDARRHAGRAARIARFARTRRAQILLAIMTRPRVLNVMPLQTAAVALGEVFPVIAEAVLERNPSLVGAGPSIAKIELQRENNGRGEKIALPSARILPLLPELEPEPAPPAAAAPEPNILTQPVIDPEPVIIPVPVVAGAAGSNRAGGSTAGRCR